jgi:hypothetical protein
MSKILETFIHLTNNEYKLLQSFGYSEQMIKHLAQKAFDSAVEKKCLELENTIQLTNTVEITEEDEAV